jgi:hypothetical protein
MSDMPVTAATATATVAAAVALQKQAVAEGCSDTAYHMSIA